ncbi:hypothetical protein H7H74_05165, partial [Mycolicibacterium chitae]|nr:hypothetical protein [Mycolicibacterium chitae]
MLTAVAIIPSAPVLVPQLAGTAADELTAAREAILAAAAALPDRWIAVGTAPRAPARPSWPPRRRCPTAGSRWGPHHGPRP